MPKLRRSEEHKTFSEIARMFAERKEVLMLFYVRNNEDLIGYSEKEILDRLDYHLREAEYDACLTLFGAIEAAFRLDVDHRHKKRLKDMRSKAARQMIKLSREHFDHRIPINDLFDLLAIDHSATKNTIDSLKVCFKYRHWLAHGRYWQLKLGRSRPTFSEVFQLAQKIKNVLIN